MHGTTGTGKVNRNFCDIPNLVLQTSIFSRTRIGIQKRILPVTGTIDVMSTRLIFLILLNARESPAE